MRREVDVTLTPPSPFKGEGFTLSLYERLFTRHYASALLLRLLRTQEADQPQRFVISILRQSYDGARTR